jgi:light-regulated signal transduction histidine kinase (bacteriophytochrome)
MSAPDDDASGVNRDLARRSERLAAAMREVETLTLAVIHDFQMPLDAIERRAVAICKGEPDVATAQAMLAIRDSVVVMNAMIGDLRELYQLGAAPLDLGPVDMEALAKAAWAGLASHDRVDFRLGTLPVVRGHRGMLELVWTNLLRGALRRSIEAPDPYVEVTGGESGEFIVYSVRDNGIELVLEYAGKLFYVFEQIQEQTEHPGMGVELAIVQRIVTRHRGNIWVEAHRHKGALFQFSLPVGDLVSTT